MGRYEIPIISLPSLTYFVDISYRLTMIPFEHEASFANEHGMPMANRLALFGNTVRCTRTF